MEVERARGVGCLGWVYSVEVVVGLGILEEEGEEGCSVDLGW